MKHLLAVLAILAAPWTAWAESCQQMAIPAYFYPGAPWTRMTATPGVGVAVMNPDSGPGTARNRDYVAAVASARAAGIKVVGYVHTSYGARRAAVVLREIATYARWYGVDGIFLDEVASEAATAGYYRPMVDAIRASAGSLVVLNPGTFPAEEYMALGDVVMVFEGTYDEYRRLRVPSWIYGYPPHRFAHVVYNASTVSRLHNAVDWSRARNAGYLYVTHDRLPNPYDVLPRYLASEAQALTTGCP